MPEFTCPQCKKSFEAKSAVVVSCRHCHKMFKSTPSVDVSVPESVSAIMLPPEPPSKSIPDALPSASLKPSLTMPGSVASDIPVTETKRQKIERIAGSKLTTGTYFTWCPLQYVGGWLKAASISAILEQGRVKQPSPSQGAGLYCVCSPMKSSTWAGEDTICLAITLANVPTICKHDKGQMMALAEGSPSLNEDALNDNSNDDAKFLWTYGGSNGGFSRLTASFGVSITADLTKIFSVEALKSERRKLTGQAATSWDKQMALLKEGYNFYK